MTVSVLVPFRDDGCEHRARAWRYVRTHYETHHDDYELVVGTMRGEWSKGMALADALERATGDVLVIADADCFIACDALRAAVVALEDAHWVVPHRNVFRLRQDAAEIVYAGGAPDRGRLVRRMYEGVAGGGLTVLRRETYEFVGGIDPRFFGWGGEDRCFGWALHVLVGPRTRLDAPLWHLWHPHPSPRHELPPASKALQLRYRAARHRPERMEEVVHEFRRPAAPTGEHPHPGHDHRRLQQRGP